MTTLTASTTNQQRRTAETAPLGRLLRAELRWILLRRRTLFAFIGLAVVPIVLGIGLAVTSASTGGAGPMSGLDALLDGNGLVLPIAVLLLLSTMLLPLIAAMFAADAIAGETANGTLRGLLVAPVGRLRLVGMKSFGVAVATLLAVLVVAVVSIVVGEIAFGGTGMLSFSGSGIGIAGALGRIGLAVLWTTLQLYGIAAVALAVSSFTEHPLIVMASTLAGLIVFNVLGGIQQLSVIHPLLITNATANNALTGLLAQPMDMSKMGDGAIVACCYLVIGLSVTALRMVNPR